MAISIEEAAAEFVRRMTAEAREENWYVGRSQLWEGEPDEFDGTIYSAPTKEERDAEMNGAPPAEVYLIAEGIRDEMYAKRMAATPELLAACAAARRMARQEIVKPGAATEWADLLRTIEAALRKADVQWPEELE